MCQLAVVILLTIFNASALSQHQPIDRNDPAKVCAIFAEIPGMQTKGYKHRYEKEYGCLSPYKDIGDGFPLSNNIAYYVKGSAYQVDELKLVLNVNVRQEAFDAHTILWKCAQLLSLKALGEMIPDETGRAIMEGKANERRFKNARVKVTREDWSTGKGYDVKFIIQFEADSKPSAPKPCFENGRKIPCR